MAYIPADLMSFSVAPTRAEGGNECREILKYWDLSLGRFVAPRYGKEFLLDELSPAVIPSLSIVDILDGGDDYRYRFWGSLNVDIKGFEMTGKLLSDGPIVDVINFGRRQFSEVIMAKEPLTFTYYGPYRSPVRRMQLTSRFPLSSDGENIDMILSYQNLRQQSDEWSVMYQNGVDQASENHEQE